MPDYTSILRRSISALPDSSPEVREAVYQRARAALARQLTAVEPPLSTGEIERQHQQLEEAVAQLESELAPQPFDDPGEPEEEEPEAYFAPAAAARSFAPRADPAARADEDFEDERADRDLDDKDDDEEEDQDQYEDARSSRTPLLVGLALLVLVIGGVTAFGFAQREALMSFLGMTEPERTETAEAPAAVDVSAPAPAAEPAATPPLTVEELAKRPDRLTNGDEPPPTPSGEAETALLPPEVPADAPASEEPPAPTAPPAAEPPPVPEQTAALEQPGQSIVAQRAIYYFQGNEGSPGQATEGTVAWAQITKDNMPAVQAILRLADRDVTTTVTVSRNTDTTLPASHLVEIQFTGEFAPSPIQRVPALVLKQTEQARGEPLNGAAVPVTDELFWIALSDNQEQINRNLQLLREGSWFDIPILFNDGTRALLTFEKGIPGDRVFETVMSTWNPT